jgi:hypothetical protein
MRFWKEHPLSFSIGAGIKVKKKIARRALIIVVSTIIYRYGEEEKPGLR